jgi:hypothetical protein
MTFPDTKKETIKVFREMLSINDSWAIRGLLRIYENQTTDEQVAETTKYHNNIGFSGAHAEIMSSFAKQYQDKGYLSKKQMQIVHKIIPHYAKQLYNIAKAEGNLND